MVAALGALTAVVLRSTDPFGESRVPHDMRTGGAAWRAISEASGAWPMVLAAVVGALVLWFTRMRGSALFLVAAVGLTAGLNPVVKALVERQRPEPSFLPADVSSSYPSGHTAVSGALLLAVVLLVHRLTGGDRRVFLSAAILASALAVTVALSQLGLGRHYPTDLMAGWLLAAAVVSSLSAARSMLSRRLQALDAARG